MTLKRRKFLLGGAALGLSPLLGQFVKTAQSEETSSRPFFVVLTDGNGWGHQGMDRRGEVLDSPSLSSPTSWELPKVLEPLASYKSRLSIVRNLNNSGDRALHGSGWSTLNGIKGDGRQPSAPSIDRQIARGAYADDPFDSLAFAVSPRRDRAAPCTSSDGRGLPYPALGSPVDAYARMFGAADGDPIETLGRERSLLEATAFDVDRARKLLVGSEARKLEQLLESQRALENQLAGQIRVFSEKSPPSFPGDPQADQMQTGPLSSAVVSAYMKLTAQAFGFGLTHVVHISLLGYDAHNIGWGFLNGEFDGEHGGDAHEDLSHVSSKYTKASATRAVEDIARFKASQVASLFSELDSLSYGDGTVLDHTVFLWVNSGGGKHHDGGGQHPFVMLGGAAGLRGGLYLDYGTKEHSVREVFSALSFAFGVAPDCPDCPEPLADLL